MAASVVNLDGIKTLLAKSLSKFFINGNPVFSNGPRNLARDPPNCTILGSLVFENFMLTDELFVKAL